MKVTEMVRGQSVPDTSADLTLLLTCRRSGRCRGAAEAGYWSRRAVADRMPAYRRLGKNDLRIAAIVLETGASLATRNFRDFRQIKGIQIEDWST